MAIAARIGMSGSLRWRHSEIAEHSPKNRAEERHPGNVSILREESSVLCGRCDNVRVGFSVRHLAASVGYIWRARADPVSGNRRARQETTRTNSPSRISVRPANDDLFSDL
jgi:hypothetical protein